MLFTLAQTEGIELTDEQLDALSGGSDWDWLYECRSVKNTDV